MMNWQDIKARRKARRVAQKDLDLDTKPHNSDRKEEDKQKCRQKLSHYGRSSLDIHSGFMSDYIDGEDEDFDSKDFLSIFDGDE